MIKYRATGFNGRPWGSSKAFSNAARAGNASFQSYFRGLNNENRVPFKGFLKRDLKGYYKGLVEGP